MANSAASRTGMIVSWLSRELDGGEVWSLRMRFMVGDLELILEVAMFEIDTLMIRTEGGCEEQKLKKPALES